LIKSIVTDMKQLKQPCIEINLETEQELLKTIIKDLEDTLAYNGRGIGLAANQIGYQYKIAIIRGKFGDVNLINPKMIEKGESITFLEGCLSLPGIKATTDRYNSITIDNNGKVEEYREVIGIIIQHELDHCNSMLITDRKRRSR